MKKLFMAVIALMMTIAASAQFYIYFRDGTVDKVDSISMISPYGNDTPDTPDTPEEPSAVIGVFSVSADKQVTFSKGNLQYTQSTNIWSFASAQWEMIGTDNVTGGSVSSDPTDGDSKKGTALADKVDLFGWSTSATNFGVSTSPDYNDYSGSFVDWGTNKIGNDAPNTWRTLTYNEWSYVVFNRPNASSLRGVAQVNGVNGLILLPDSWTCPSGVTFKAGFHSNFGADYYATYQSFTADQWSKLESAGAVFLPAVGVRNSLTVDVMQNFGNYWSSTENFSNYAYCLYFVSNEADVLDISYNHGISVRLVKDVEWGTTPDDPSNPDQPSDPADPTGKNYFENLSFTNAVLFDVDTTAFGGKVHQVETSDGTETFNCYMSMATLWLCADGFYLNNRGQWDGSELATYISVLAPMYFGTKFLNPDRGAGVSFVLNEWSVEDLLIDSLKVGAPGALDETKYMAYINYFVDAYNRGDADFQSNLTHAKTAFSGATMNTLEFHYATEGFSNDNYYPKWFPDGLITKASFSLNADGVSAYMCGIDYSEIEFVPLSNDSTYMWGCALTYDEGQNIYSWGEASPTVHWDKKIVYKYGEKPASVPARVSRRLTQISAPVLTIDYPEIAERIKKELEAKKIKPLK